MEKRDYIGNQAQLLDVRRFELSEGKAKGVACIEIQNSAGLSVTILQDRCMDLGSLRYRGVNYSYQTANGIVAPEYYYGSGESFYRSFTGGMMATCGLDNTGPDCSAAGREHFRHGLAGNIPAENISIVRGEDQGTETVTVKGEVHQTCFMQESLILKREYVFSDNSPAFKIRDRVLNAGGQSVPFVIMYHFNLGYPLLSEFTRVHIPARTVRPRNGNMEEMESYGVITPPGPDSPPQAFFHDLEEKDGNGEEIRIYNEKLCMGLLLNFSRAQLPKLVQWKLLRPKEYVMGIEPCSAFPLGRKRLLEEGSMTVLEPGEERAFELSVCPYEG